MKIESLLETVFKGMAFALAYQAVENHPELAAQVVKALAGLESKPQHPEAAEPIVTVIDEHQMGRDEVCREIATPRPN